MASIMLPWGRGRTQRTETFLRATVTTRLAKSPPIGGNHIVTTPPETPAPRPVRSGGTSLAAGWQFVACALAIAAIVAAADLGWLRPISVWVHSIPLGDKLVHAFAMGLLCWLADRAIPSRPVATHCSWLRWTPAIVTLVVLGEEVSQRWIPGRSFDLGDITADLVGIGVALWLRAQSH